MGSRRIALSELTIAGFALVSLVVAQLVLSSAIHGANYYGVDGKMTQTTILATLRFGGVFDITNLNPLQGVGSQLLTKNAWANPSFWPFALLPMEAATDLSAAIALGCFAAACYIMMRCFDVPLLPSAVAAQLSIGLFAPVLLLIYTPTNFCLGPGDAVVYAPYMIALGLLARLEPGSWRRFSFTSIAITGLVLYSAYCDPLWTMVGAICWAVAFATITFWPIRPGGIALRCAALACCLATFVVSGVAVYLYSASQYTARVQFAPALDRVRSMAYVSAVSYSSNMKYFYLLFVVGFLVGLATARGRPRALIAAAAISWAFYVCYSLVYLLLLNSVWVPPIPIYMEQCLFVLFLAASVAGYWTGFYWMALQGAAFMLSIARRMRILSILSHRQIATRSFPVPVPLTIVLTLVIVAIIPAKIVSFSLRDAGPYAEIFNDRWPDQPELNRFFVERMALTIGGPFRGSVNFLTTDHDAGNAIAALWSRGVATTNEYSQLVTPPSLYFIHALLNRDIRDQLNRFQPFWSDGTYYSPIGMYSPIYWKALAALGVRYTAERSALPSPFNPGLRLVTIPYRPQSPDQEPGFWYVYELPHPNFGDYSPTQVTKARTGAEIMLQLSHPDFDFTKRVVLTTDMSAPLVPAEGVRMSVIRNGLHLAAHSDHTSLIVLPHQFSYCLTPRASDVRLVRADLMLTGVVFSGEIDTDITFDYGLFSPWCRLRDLADMKSLDLKIDLRMPHLTGGQVFPDWQGARERLEAAARMIR